MLGKNKKITKTEPYRLSSGNVEYDEIKFQKIKKHRLRKVFVLYIFTVGIIFILCASLLFLSIFGDRSGVMTDVWGLFIENSFPDLSLSWMKDSIPVGGVFDITEGILLPSKPSNGNISEETDNEVSTSTKEENTVSISTLYDFDYSKVPEGEIPIIPMDLSLVSYGPAYIHNSTGLTPDTEALLDMELGYGTPLEYLSVSSAPTVLIIHTHGTESYSEDGAISYKDDGGELARSSDTDKNVIAVGKVLSDSLRKKGIISVHSEVMHDAEGYRDAYARAEETIRLYLDRYPTIKLVIDIHRDSVIKSSGELVRPVTVVNGTASAQIMCVVGSNWGGEENDRWETNLALALQFREELNGQYTNICRPVYLKSSTYNQEIAPYSLLLEIGSSGNSLEEACIAAEAAAEAIATVLMKK
ncbi:MAG: stage II sporulation protein P [Clostridia bacterium]|nr:stage II sporulation protein P [Clostridia bacterium]